MRILIVEDDPRIARFLEKGLIAEGHFCTVAADGKTGLALALEGDFDLVLLDPPSFSNSKSMEGSFDVQRDHAELVRFSG